MGERRTGHSRPPGRLRTDSYFARTPPKSTGRELFNLPWACDRAIGPGHAPNDVQSTLCQLTVDVIAEAIERDCPDTIEAYICGGGTANEELMKRLRTRLPRISVATTAALDPDWVEAVAFAWLAQHLVESPGNLPAVTGASGPKGARVHLPGVVD